MTVKYNVVERANPQDREAPKKFYASIESSGHTTTRQLAERASKMCTLSTPDMLAAIESLLSIIPEELANGNVVELGDFGSFWLRASSDGTETSTEVHPAQISNVLPRFIAGKQFKRALQTIVFNKN